MASVAEQLAQQESTPIGHIKPKQIPSDQSNYVLNSLTDDGSISPSSSSSSSSPSDDQPIALNRHGSNRIQRSNTLKQPLQGKQRSISQPPVGKTTIAASAQVGCNPSNNNNAAPSIPNGGDASSSCRDPYIVQRYIMNPLLIGGKKFDLRVYVLVDSYSPLSVWIYK